MKNLIERPRSIGLAAGALWLIAISFVFAIWSLLAIGTLMAKNILIGTSILLFILIAISIMVLRMALVLPKSIKQPTQKKQHIWRNFALIVGAEVLAFGIVNSILAATGNFELIPSLDLIIVGVHFFPLARIFRVPRYYIMGFFFCAIPIVTLLAIPKQLMVGQILAWFIVPSLGCGFVASLTAAAGLYEVWQSVSKIRDAT